MLNHLKRTEVIHLTENDRTTSRAPMDSASGAYRKKAFQKRLSSRETHPLSRGLRRSAARRALRSYLAWLCSLRLHAGPFGARGCFPIVLFGCYGMVKAGGPAAIAQCQ